MQSSHGTATPSLSQLLALLDLVGPAEAPGLLAQLQADLATCDAMILAAVPSGDWLALRRASHNLTALAGTAGAEALQRLAEDMNRAAHDQDQTALDQIAPPLRAGLAVLIGQIAGLADTKGPG